MKRVSSILVLLTVLAASAPGLIAVPKASTFWHITLPQTVRPYPTLQPKMPPPARHLFVANMSKLPADQCVLLASLQGVVNRTKPRIFLIWKKNNAFWLKQMVRQGDTGTPIMVRHPLTLVRRFRSAIHGAVVPDSKIYDSPDIAADIAAVDNLVIATPKLARRLNLPIRMDLRGKFSSDAAALKYLRVDLAPRMNPYLFLWLTPPLLADGGEDQIIAARGMTFWVTGRKAASEPGADMAAEKTQLERLFAQTPLDGMVRGFPYAGSGMGLDEGPGVTLASQFGKITVASDFLRDMSVFSSVRLSRIRQRFAPPPAYDPSKVYLSFTISDGDNLCLWENMYQHWFTNPWHGKFAIGWGMGPTLIDEAPTLVKWYYQHAAPTDEFICDVSGAGYIYPPQWARRLTNRPAAFKDFYHWTWRYMRRMDMKTLRLMQVNRRSIAEAGRALPHVRFLMPDYGYQHEKRYSRITYSLPSGQVVFRAATGGGGAKNLANQIRHRVGKHRPAFLNVFVYCWRNNLKDLADTLKLLGPDYVDVTPSQLHTLYREAHAGGAP